jgi:L-ascorbate metabolism protein UlaG (beta-lactamase superfamily)
MMALEITWIGHASFRLATGESVVYIDPWKLNAQPHDADIVFVSHSHYDHCSGDDIAAVSGSETTLIAPADAIETLHAANAVSPGECMTIRDVTLETTAAYNIGKDFHPKGNHCCGCVLTLAGQRVYYAGDTDLIPEMQSLRGVDLALLPVGGTYTLTAEEAARACKAIDCRLAIPYHWGDIVGDVQDAQTFAEQAPCEVRILQPGQSTELCTRMEARETRDIEIVALDLRRLVLLLIAPVAAAMALLAVFVHLIATGASHVGLSLLAGLGMGAAIIALSLLEMVLLQVMIQLTGKGVRATVVAETSGQAGPATAIGETSQEEAPADVAPEQESPKSSPASSDQPHWSDLPFPDPDAELAQEEDDAEAGNGEPSDDEPHWSEATYPDPDRV